MNEIWKKRARIALRGFEIVLAVTLLAVLVELVLVMMNAPGPVPEIRFIRASTPPPETAAPTHLVAVELPHVPAPPVQEKPVVAAPPVRRPAPPVLLDFENLRRLLGGAKAPAVNQPSGTGGQAFAGGNQGSSPTMQLVAVTPMVLLGTNVIPATPTPPSTNNVPPAERPKETNRVDNPPATISTNNVSTNNNSPVFRISVP